MKQKLKAEAEQWVKTQIPNEKPKPNACPPKSEENGTNTTSETTQIVTSTAAAAASSDGNNSNSTVLKQSSDEDVSTSAEQNSNNFKYPAKQPLLPTPNSACSTVVASASSACHMEEVSSSSNKELDADHSSVTSCSTSTSTGALTDNSSVLQSSQESVGGLGLSAGDFSDPREDYEEEKEGRTNLKTTNEREVENLVASNETSPGKYTYILISKKIKVF